MNKIKELRYKKTRQQLRYVQLELEETQMVYEDCVDNEWGPGAWNPDFSEFEKQIENAILNTGVVDKLKNSLGQPGIKYDVSVNKLPCNLACV